MRKREKGVVAEGRKEGKDWVQREAIGMTGGRAKTAGDRGRDER